jgi:trimeric autotransporter adhesin
MQKKRAFALIAFAFVLALAAVFTVVQLVRAFNGPPSGCTPPNCQGAVGVNGSNNLSVGTTTPLANTKFLIVASDTSASNYSLKILQPATTPILVVQNNGYLGIATTSPAYQLDVVGTVRATTLLGNYSGTLTANNVTNGVFGSCGGCGGGVYSFPSNLGVATSTNGTLPATLSVYGGGYFSGNVGIGTTGPSNPLTVNGNISTNSNLIVGGTTNTSGFSFDVQVGQARFASGFSSLAQSLVSNGTFTDPASGQTYGLKVSQGLAVTGNVVLATQSGNVGIGTTNPGQKLEVVGNVSSSAVCLGGTCNSTWPSGGGTVGGSGTANYVPLWTAGTTLGNSAIYQSGGNVGIATTNTIDLLTVGNGAGTAGVGVNVGTGVNNGQFRFYRNGTYEGGLTMPNSSNDLWLISGGNAAVGVDVNNGGMSVGSYMGVNAAPSNGMIVSGNVGIGTTGPGAKLDVEGGGIYGIGAESHLSAGAFSDPNSGILRDLKLGSNGLAVNGGIVVNTGNVGIGTTNPGQKLEVVGNVSSSALCLGGTCNSTWPSGGVTSVFGRTGAVMAASGDYSVGQVTGAAPLASPTFTGNVTMPGTGIWNSSGNVGIGTTGPGAKLDVAGGINLEANGTNDAPLEVGYTATSPAGYYATYAP